MSGEDRLPLLDVGRHGDHTRVGVGRDDVPDEVLPFAQDRLPRSIGTRMP
jgi:hypothetical protein